MNVTWGTISSRQRRPTIVQSTRAGSTISVQQISICSCRVQVCPLPSVKIPSPSSLLGCCRLTFFQLFLSVWFPRYANSTGVYSGTIHSFALRVTKVGQSVFFFCTIATMFHHKSKARMHRLEINAYKRCQTRWNRFNDDVTLTQSLLT